MLRAILIVATIIAASYSIGSTAQDNSRLEAEIDELIRRTFILNRRERFGEAEQYARLCVQRAEALSQVAKEHGFSYQVRSTFAPDVSPIKLDTTGFACQQAEAIAFYKTQFPSVLMQAYGEFAKRYPYEEVILTNSQLKLPDDN